eukprot:12843434-Ditylum_brightwellii.AAC.1
MKRVANETPKVRTSIYVSFSQIIGINVRKRTGLTSSDGTGKDDRQLLQYNADFVEALQYTTYS